MWAPSVLYELNAQFNKLHEFERQERQRKKNLEEKKEQRNVIILQNYSHTHTNTFCSVGLVACLFAREVFTRTH